MKNKKRIVVNGDVWMDTVTVYSENQIKVDGCPWMQNVVHDIVPDGKVGFVCEPTVEGVHKAIVQLYEGDALQRFAENFPAERKRFSWATMCDKLVEVYNQTK